MVNKSKSELPQAKKYIIAGGAWFLIAPVIYRYVTSQDILKLNDFPFYSLLLLILGVGAGLIGYGYYDKSTLRKPYNLLVAAGVVVVYMAIGYYYFFLLSLLDWLV